MSSPVNPAEEAAGRRQADHPDPVLQRGGDPARSPSPICPARCPASTSSSGSSSTTAARDRTVEVARSLGVDHVVSHPHNRGLAAAFMTGLDACLRAGADVIVNTDADNQYQGSSIPDLVAPVLSGDAEMVVGERPIETIDDFSRTKKLLQRLGSSVVRRFSGTGVRDAASGFRAYSRDAAMRVQVFGQVHLHDGNDRAGRVERRRHHLGADRREPQDAGIAPGQEHARATSGDRRSRSSAASRCTSRSASSSSSASSRSSSARCYAAVARAVPLRGRLHEPRAEPARRDRPDRGGRPDLGRGIPCRPASRRTDASSKTSACAPAASTTATPTTPPAPPRSSPHPPPANFAPNFGRLATGSRSGCSG